MQYNRDMRHESSRPDPDELLARVKEAATRQERGKLKIFLGYAAGVGKTYAMLEAAHQRLREGVDVVVGYADAHGSEETERLLDGLEVIPSQRFEGHGGIQIGMDLDAILARHPRL